MCVSVSASHSSRTPCRKVRISGNMPLLICYKEFCCTITSCLIELQSKAWNEHLILRRHPSAVQQPVICVQQLQTDACLTLRVATGSTGMHRRQARAWLQRD